MEQRSAHLLCGQVDEHAQEIMNVLLALHALDHEFEFDPAMASILRHLMIQVEVRVTFPPIQMPSHGTQPG